MLITKKNQSKILSWEWFEYDYMLKEIAGRRGERNREVVISDEKRDSQ